MILSPFSSVSKTTKVETHSKSVKVEHINWLACIVGVREPSRKYFYFYKKYVKNIKIMSFGT